ncbi:cupin domain-containing protein [Mycolicibacterium mengxianglii]|uniref:cupin domain-containing protein n=1 Tax=Mycolicibacterium mengxianglii TaxID=2736649 RepID=UPI0018EF0833|nr:cupin domain-containing protein [Mycolicibacterium mengxianglii]
MDAISLTTVIEELTAAARSADAGRAARTVHGGQDHFLRQTLIALNAGRELGEHESPGEATLQVLKGNVRLTAGDVSCEGVAGDYLVIPPVRHGLTAIDDSVVLLTVLADRDKAVDARV